MLSHRLWYKKPETVVEAPKPQPLPQQQALADTPLDVGKMQQQLEAKGISVSNKGGTIDGNGSLVYTENGVEYQVRYLNGKPTALRAKDAGNNISYYKYENGKKVPISRSNYMDYVTDSRNARNAAELKLKSQSNATTNDVTVETENITPFSLANELESGGLVGYSREDIHSVMLAENYELINYSAISINGKSTFTYYDRIHGNSVIVTIDDATQRVVSTKVETRVTFDDKFNNDFSSNSYMNPNNSGYDPFVNDPDLYITPEILLNLDDFNL